MHLETTWRAQQKPGYRRKWSEIAFGEKLWYSVVSKNISGWGSLVIHKKHDEAMWWTAQSVLVCFLRMNEQTSNYRLKAYQVGSPWKRHRQPTELQWTVGFWWKHQNSVHLCQKTSHCLCRPLFRSYWPWWKPLELVMTQNCSKRLCRVGKISTKTHVSLCPPAPPNLWSVPNKNRDKMIMTRLAFTRLSHRSIMSENEIDLKILHRPKLEQKGLLCWLY